MGPALEIVERTLGLTATVSPEARRLTVPVPGPGSVTDLLVRLREARIEVGSLSMDKPSLDEVFLTLTGHGTAADTPADDDPGPTDPGPRPRGDRAATTREAGRRGAPPPRPPHRPSRRHDAGSRRAPTASSRTGRRSARPPSTP
ncbi:Uncharacterised protein [Mycobacteroides abscessus]|nr:Uncharacterised protein [Mycobacteroides abscessus]